MKGIHFTKRKTDLKFLFKLAGYWKVYLPLFLISIFFSVAGAFCSIVGPEMVRDLTDSLTKSIAVPAGADLSVVSDICISLICLYAAGAIAGYVSQFLMATITQEISHKLRIQIVQKINRVPLHYFDQAMKGDLLSRVTNDVEVISQTLGSGIANLVSGLALFLGVVYQMFALQWALASVTIGASIVGFLVMGVILSKSQKYFNRKQADLGEMNGQIEEVITNHELVTSFCGREEEQKKFLKKNEDLYVDNSKSQFLSGIMTPIMGFIGNLCHVLIFLFGVAFIIEESGATLGTIFAFVLYARLFSQPLSTFAQSMASLQQASAASKRVFEFFSERETEREEARTEAPGTVRGDIEFQNVRFGYLPGKEVIHGFSASLKSGQKVAIVGPTGAGKTTLVNLLMRFYECEGEITIDGVSIRDKKREDLHDLFGVVLQDAWLFRGTIRENLVFRQKDVSDQRLDEICEAVGLEHLIRTLPKGYDTILSDSLHLSEGQKQQLAIARAMIENSPFFIFDEATSSVDPRTEAVIRQATDRLTAGRTCLIVSHRLSTIRDADVILVMKDGNLVEQGTHEELMRRNGFYAELYKSQFSAA